MTTKAVENYDIPAVRWRPVEEREFQARVRNPRPIYGFSQGWKPIYPFRWNAALKGRSSTTT